MPRRSEQTGLSNRQRLLARILHELDIPLDMSSFETRHNKQKLFSILESMDVNLGYRFNWYIHGPYSPRLAKDLYEIHRNRHEIGDQVDEFPLDEEIETTVDRIGEVLGRHLGDKEYMEMLGSVLYLHRKRGNLEDSVHRLKDLKPDLEFSSDEILKATEPLVST